MKIEFAITDEKTVINETVKLGLQITGLVLDQSKEDIVARCKDVLGRVVPQSGASQQPSWAWSAFDEMNHDGFPRFSVTATTRVNESDIFQLDDRIRQINDIEKNIQVRVFNKDVSVPLYQLREAESDLRLSLLERADNEAKKIGSAKVRKIVIMKPEDVDMRFQSKGFAATSYAAATDSPHGGSSFGASQKIVLSAIVTVEKAS